MRRPVLSARLRTMPPEGRAVTSKRRFELRCSDEQVFTTFDVTLEDLGDGTWRATAVVGGDPTTSSAKGCDDVTQEGALVKLSDWARRLHEGLVIVTSPTATVKREIVEIEGSADAR